MTYREHPALNQSYLKALCTGVGTKRVLKGPAIRMGSLIDCLLTTPELWDILYYVADIEHPAPDIKAIIGVIGEWNKESVLDVADLMEFKGVGKGKWELDTVWDKLSKYEDYWKSIVDCGNRELITTAEYEIALHVSNLLKTHPFTRAFISHPKLEVLYQYDFYWNYKGYECKGLADTILINNGDDLKFANGFIFPANSFMIVDIKTGTKNPKKLIDSMIEWNYYFQLSYYYMGMQGFRNMNQINPVIVYAQQSLRDFPTWYQFTDEDLRIGKQGLKERKYWDNGRYTEYQYIYGYDQAFKILEYEDKHLWNIPNGKLIHEFREFKR